MERLTQRTDYGMLLRKDIDICVDTPDDFDNLQHVLSILSDYEDIGPTPEQLLEIDKMYSDKCREVAELREKQTPYKPDEYTGTAWNGVGVCKCGVIFMDRTTNYCGNCGQRLDWGD